VACPPKGLKIEAAPPPMMICSVRKTNLYDADPLPGEMPVPNICF
jgi:hypothetical protein